MSERNTVVRSMHDLGLAAWFGGSLMGAVGLNGATAQALDPRERLTLSSKGWGRWAPVNALGIGAHIIGSLGLIAGNEARLAKQPEAQSNTAIKAGLTGVALVLTAYSGLLGTKVAKHAGEGGAGATEPSPRAWTSSCSSTAAWDCPVVTGTATTCRLRPSPPPLRSTTSPRSSRPRASTGR